jgi:Tfp pilus assembly protein PilX
MRLPAFRRERGIALVTTLLLLMLLSAVTIGMVLAASSDELINGYYRNMRGSFYAADSGLNIVRQAMEAQVAAAVPTTMPDLSVQPIAPGTESTVASYITSTYGSNTSLNSGYAANSWPARFRVTNVTLAQQAGNGCVIGGTYWAGTCDAPIGPAASPVNPAAPQACSTIADPDIETQCEESRPTYTYNYDYSLEVVGETRASELTTLEDTGTLRVIVAPTPGAGTETSFAAWGFFVDNFEVCAGMTLVGGTVTGPAFTNDGWTFSTTSVGYTFTDPVGQVEPNFGYSFPGGCGCDESPNDPYSCGGRTINPNFQGGYNLDQAEIPLPDNDYNQKRAVLDGVGGDTNPSAAEMAAILKTVDADPWSAGAEGVYLPYETDVDNCPAGVAPCMVGGGIYVEGDATVVMTASSTDGDRQIYTIVDDNGVTTTVTVDLTADAAGGFPNGFTRIQSGGDDIYLQGVPTFYENGPSGKTPIRDATMFYVNGDLTSLRGGSGNDIQDGHAITVVAAEDVTITNDITYETRPVTTAQNQIPGTPPATLIPGNDNGQVLGIYTNGGDIILDNAGNSTLDIHASLAALKNGATRTIRNAGDAISTLNIMGGRIQNNMGNINTTTRNIYFDRRFSAGGFAPPWFPSTTVEAGTGSEVPPPDTNVSRVRWVNKTPF